MPLHKLHRVVVTYTFTTVTVTLTNYTQCGFMLDPIEQPVTQTFDKASIQTQIENDVLRISDASVTCSYGPMPADCIADTIRAVQPPPVFGMPVSGGKWVQWESPRRKERVAARQCVNVWPPK